MSEGRSRGSASAGWNWPPCEPGGGTATGAPAIPGPSPNQRESSPVTRPTTPPTPAPPAAITLAAISDTEWSSCPVRTSTILPAASPRWPAIRPRPAAAAEIRSPTKFATPPRNPNRPPEPGCVVGVVVPPPAAAPLPDTSSCESASRRSSTASAARCCAVVSRPGRPVLAQVSRERSASMPTHSKPCITVSICCASSVMRWDPWSISSPAARPASVSIPCVTVTTPSGRAGRRAAPRRRR